MVGKRYNGPVVRRNLKATDQVTGRFEGYLAVFGNVDGGGDVIDRGAFTKTIADAQAKASQSGKPFLWPVLWQHDQNQPIGGILSAKEDSYGLYIVGQLDLDTEEGHSAYSGLVNGYISGLSIGYNATKASYKDGARHLTEIQLWEGSVVTFPMNELATVSAVKAAKVGSPEAQWLAFQRRVDARRARKQAQRAGVPAPAAQRLEARLKSIGAKIAALSTQQQVADLDQRMQRAQYLYSQAVLRTFGDQNTGERLKAQVRPEFQ